MIKPKCIVVVLVMGACVDPISFPIVDARDIVVVDGSINDAPGPYLVKISRGLRLNSDTVSNIPVNGAKITLHSDTGESEASTETEPGEYQTAGVIRGTVGVTYHIDIQMADGSTFESEPETILPSGHVTDIFYRYEARTTEKIYGTVAADVLNIFVDSEEGDAPPGESSFVRWRFKGTYKTVTFPQKHKTYLSGDFYYLTPFECSGYVVEPGLGGGILTQVAECTCCTCYVKQFETEPRLSDTDIVTNGEFRNVKVGEIPITRASFYEKYKVEIEQMTISKTAFDFFRIMRVQKEGASNLFQPAQSELKGNIKPVNADYQIVGLFWGASITSNSTYITKDAIPYRLPVDSIAYPCTDAFKNSTTVKPADWND